LTKIKVMSIFGTRPEANKMAPLIQELQKREAFESIVAVTAQHRQMLDQSLQIFNLTPDYDLNIMQEHQSLSDITCRALTGLEAALREAKPDIVLAHGDTTTTFAASLAAFYQGVKLGHVEAGLRTYDKYQPWPEEMNRKLTGALADLHFAPTALAKSHLLKENIGEDCIFITGNTAIDCLKTTVSNENYIFRESLLNTIEYGAKRVIAMTAHRRENLGKPLEDICRAVKRIAEAYEDVAVVYAVHYNPAVRETAFSILKDCPRVYLTDPLDMADMHNLIRRSYLVLTDSGGLQEEAPALQKPVIVLRNVTERPEGVETGVLTLAGTAEDDVFEAATALLEDAALYRKMSLAPNPFGDGKASERICDAILYAFGLKPDRPMDYLPKTRG